VSRNDCRDLARLTVADHLLPCVSVAESKKLRHARRIVPTAPANGTSPAPALGVFAVMTRAESRAQVVRLRRTAGHVATRVAGVDGRVGARKVLLVGLVHRAHTAAAMLGACLSIQRPSHWPALPCSMPACRRPGGQPKHGPGD
jgi:hypothetical protein